ncbi:CotH kinase family protein [Chitinispirillales bacterium ANBcel5]|uniref:CotH kinase family protein n=1 Tax=Cellulosispirillum alkaliphilum TaxID=3039283 RepID=UPI002A55C00D|nr:CotH kinase family protein [Chitinispirillales bacterium ANBcel5]
MKRVGLFLSFIITITSTNLYSRNLIINELMASNSETIADEDGDYEDWIEITNTGNSTVNLQGYGLSDSEGNPLKWTFPNVSIEPNQYLLIWASGKDRSTSQAIHTNFKISASGEKVTLSLPSGEIIDRFPGYPVPTDFSMGRRAHGSDWYYFIDPTPGHYNSTEPYTTILEPPEFAVAPGFYNSTVYLPRPDYDENVEIRYTLDGSEPTENSALLESSIEIRDRSHEPNDIANIQTTYIQRFGPPWVEPERVDKGTVVRMAAFSEGSIPSETVTGTFFVFPQGESMYSLPVTSVTTERENFFSDSSGIYVPGDHYTPGDDASGNFSQRGVQWERAGHIEYFDQNKVLRVSQGVGFRIHGGWTRRFPQKSLRIYARNRYGGNNSIDYKFFPNKESESFRRLLLRNSGNDFERTMFRDGVTQLMVKHLDFDTQGFSPSVVFINGEYWGIKNFRERYDKHYLERVYGADPDNIDYLSLKRYEGNFFVEVDEGDDRYYQEMINFVVNNDMSDDENYSTLQTYMDVNNFLDYYSVQIYLQNDDWPHNNNDFWRVRKPYDPNAPKGLDGRFRWLLYDIDRSHGLFSRNPDMISFVIDQNYELLDGLLQNQSFRTDFINRHADLLNSAFIPERALSILDSVYQMIDPEIDRHIRRWNVPEDKQEWIEYVNEIRASIHSRPSQLQQHIISHFGLNGTTQVQLNNDINYGYIKLNSLIIDEELPGVSQQVYPWSGTYFNGNPIRLQTVPKSGYQLKKWIINGVEYEENVLEIDPANGLEIETVYEPASSAQTKNRTTIQTQIKGNFPNPFTTSTSIQFSISQSEDVKVKIIDLKGRNIATLLQQNLNPGPHSVTWDAKGVTSGVYFCILQAGKRQLRKPLYLVR